MTWPLRLEPQIPVETPDGPGLAFLLDNAGDERDLLWTVWLDNGECWTYQNRHIRARRNVTMGRTSPTKPVSAMQESR